MFQSFKTTLSAAFLFLTLTTVSHAQFSLNTSDFYNYDTSVENNEVTAGFSFDEATGTLVVTGSNNNDDCTVDIKSNYWIVVTLKTPSEIQTKYFYFSQLKEIVFEGHDGDDSFAFTDHAINCMSYLKSVTDSFDLVCDLRGGPGLDYLSAGIGCDILSGGDDDLQDILIGGPGADLFLNQRDLQLVPYYSWSTHKYSYFQYSDNEEFEMILDYSKYEGDLEMFADELERYLNPIPDDLTPEMYQDIEETSDDDTSSENTTSKTFFDEEEEQSLFFKK